MVGVRFTLSKKGWGPVEQNFGLRAQNVGLRAQNEELRARTDRLKFENRIYVATVTKFIIEVWPDKKRSELSNLSCWIVVSTLGPKSNSSGVRSITALRRFLGVKWLIAGQGGTFVRSGII